MALDEGKNFPVSLGHRLGSCNTRQDVETAVSKTLGEGVKVCPGKYLTGQPQCWCCTSPPYSSADQPMPIRPAER